MERLVRLVRLARRALLVTLAGSSGAGCFDVGTFACNDPDNCSLAPGGVCLPEGCAYPDTSCQSNQRYSEHAEEGFAGACVELPGETDTGGTKPCANGCSGHGSCVELPEGPRCLCDAGWYAVAGECREDPCGAYDCIYVDPLEGDDQGAGSREAPYASVARGLQDLTGSQPGRALVVRRGRQAMRLDVSAVTGTAEADVLLGAYGPVTDPAPRLEGAALLDTAYITVRGLQLAASGGDCIEIARSDHFVVTDNQVGPCGGHGVSIHDGATDGAVAGNRIAEIAASGIDLRARSSDGARALERHFLVDNVLAGPFDETAVFAFANGNDLKVIGNRIAYPTQTAMYAQSMAGVWVLGNTVGGASTPATDDVIRVAGDGHTAGNLVFDGSGTVFTGWRAAVHNNTVVGSAAEVWEIGGNADVDHNLVLGTAGPLTEYPVAQGTNAAGVLDNWYGPTTGSDLSVCSVRVMDVGVQSFEAWMELGADAGSVCGPVPWLATPAWASIDDWATEGFFDGFVPDAGWEGCALGGGHAGAFDCAGNRVPPRVVSREGVGKGWEGPLDVRLRYPDLMAD